MRRRSIVAGLACALWAWTTCASGQPESGAAPDEGAAHPGVLLGRRIAATRALVPTRPTLVIVPDGASYLAQIGAWSPEGRWPVLIDDGSDAAREDIARFARAFGAREIVRWRAQDGGVISRDAIERAVARAWDVETPAELPARWAAMGAPPTGVVVTSEAHPCWPAGAALAAGRAQPLLWSDVGARNPGGMMKPEEIGALEREIGAGLEALGSSWAALGDDADAVTLCLRLPGRLPAPDHAKAAFALTDRIGRHRDGTRFAWCGQIFDDEAASAYRAMSALFAPAEGAWLFDSYADRGGPPYAAARAVGLLERAGIEFVLTPPEAADLGAWRSRTRGGIDATLVHVNSSGMAHWFDLAEGRASASDVAPLLRPAIVHFIHSFSAQKVDRETTIANRWLTHGAAAYVGAVDEPFLGAFVPAEALVARLLGGMPVGAAARVDGAPAWKVQVIGDPLMMLLPPAGGVAPPAEIDGAVEVEHAMREALRERRLAEGARELVILGRDADAVALARAAMAGEGIDAEMRSAVARQALHAAFRVVDAELVAQLYALLPESVGAGETERALLWQALRPGLETRTLSREAVEVLRAHIRDETASQDASALRPLVRELYGEGAVEAMYLGLIENVKSRRELRRLREALGR